MKSEKEIRERIRSCKKNEKVESKDKDYDSAIFLQTTRWALEWVLEI